MSIFKTSLGYKLTTTPHTQSYLQVQFQINTIKIVTVESIMKLKSIVKLNKNGVHGRVGEFSLCYLPS